MPESTPAEQHADIKQYNTEDWLYEDSIVGQKDRSIRRTIAEGEAMLFNSLVLDMHPYVGDQKFATEEGPFTYLTTQHPRKIQSSTS